MELNGITLGTTSGTTWKYMELHGTTWNYMGLGLELHGTTPGTAWNYTLIDCTPCFFLFVLGVGSGRFSAEGAFFFDF